MDGILLVDKPGACTSHDVVAHARRALGQRDVGHAGTLDPLATGVLVLLLGEATKLSPYLTADDKAYAATVRFGAATDTLDADGAVTARSLRAPPSRAAIEAALAAMVGPLAQVPPAVSAIKQGGVASHERARRGEEVVLAPRDVVLHEARVTAVRDGECDLEISCSKGFYVRSLARDLAVALGDLGHLTALRRTRSGAFTLDGALDGAALARAARARDLAALAAVRAAVLPLVAASRAMAALTVDEPAAVSLRCGRAIAAPAGAAPGAVLVLANDVPVCIGRIADGVLTVQRGLNPSPA